MNKKKIIIIIAVLVIVGIFIGAVVFAQTKSEDSTSGAPKGAVPVSVEPVHRETITTIVNANGEVILEEKETIYPESQAKIQDITVEVGDKVSVGQVVVKYDEEYLEQLYDQLEEANLALKSARLALDASKLPLNDIETTASEAQILQSENAITELENQIAQLDVKISQAETQLTDKYVDFDNKKMLFENGVISKSELDMAEDEIIRLEDELETMQIQRNNLVTSKTTAEDSLALSKQAYNDVVDKSNTQESVDSNRINAQEVAVQQAQIRVEQIQEEIDEFETGEIAPISGTVLSISAVEGSFASPSMPIMEIGEISNDNLVLQVEVPENKAAEIEAGQNVMISGDALGDDEYKGVVEKVLPKAEERQIGTTMETVILVNVKATGETLPVHPGNTLTADITTNISDNAVVVPLVSTYSDEDGNDFVYIMKDDFSCEKRIVDLGSYSGLYIEAEGVTEGENIVLDPPKTLKNGDFVDPINLEENKEGKDAETPAESTETPTESTKPQ